jgi:hypothetical protein
MPAMRAGPVEAEDDAGACHGTVRADASRDGGNRRASTCATGPALPKMTVFQPFFEDFARFG